MVFNWADIVVPRALVPTLVYSSTRAPARLDRTLLTSVRLWLVANLVVLSGQSTLERLKLESLQDHH